MAVILGLDPGSRVTGYGVVTQSATGWVYLDSGCIRTRPDDPMGYRLVQLFRAVTALIAQWQPTESVIEQVFLARNADSALKLGQARGALLTALAQQDLPIHEYTARQIKQAVVGTGNADKTQVQHMVQRLLKLDRAPQADAADALAAALCHAHARANLSRLHGIGLKHGRAQGL